MLASQTQEPIRGAWPVMPTPFTSNLSVDWEAIDPLVDFYIERGVAGIFTDSMSSELFFLQPYERYELARHVVARANRRVPVVASAVGAGSLDSWKDAIERTFDAGVDSVVLITSLLANRDETDWTWRNRLEEILEAVPSGDLGLYECPVPYKRLIEPGMLSWAASTGRFTFFKDTCQSLETMKEKIGLTTGTGLGFYNAEMSSLLASLEQGGHGFSGLAANMYPDVVAWLIANFKTQSDQVYAAQRLLTAAEHAVGHHYPASAKFLLAEHYGLPLLPNSRMSLGSLTKHDTDPLLQMAEYIESQHLTSKV